MASHTHHNINELNKIVCKKVAASPGITRQELIEFMRPHCRDAKQLSNLIVRAINAHKLIFTLNDSGPRGKASAIIELTPAGTLLSVQPAMAKPQKPQKIKAAPASSPLASALPHTVSPSPMPSHPFPPMPPATLSLSTLDSTLNGAAQAFATQYSTQLAGQIVDQVVAALPELIMQGLRERLASPSSLFGAFMPAPMAPTPAPVEMVETSAPIETPAPAPAPAPVASVDKARTWSAPKAETQPAPVSAPAIATPKPPRQNAMADALAGIVDKVRRPKLAIVGLFPGQLMEVKREFEKVFDLRMPDMKVTGTSLANAVHDCRWVILMSKNVGQHHISPLKDHPGKEYMQGSTSMLKTRLAELAQFIAHEAEAHA